METVSRDRDIDILHVFKLLDDVFKGKNSNEYETYIAIPTASHRRRVW